jgi:hypothetical protein
MTRRIVAIVLTLAGVAAALLLTSTAASAQIGLPGIDIVALLRSILESFPPILRNILGPVFNTLLRFFGGGCVPPFCASA